MPLGRWPDVTIAKARKQKAAIVLSISRDQNPRQKRAEDRRRRPAITLEKAFNE